MARKSQYSRWRRVASQGVLCLVFAATLAAAAYLSRARQPEPVVLGPVRQFDQLEYRLPEGWSITTKLQKIPQLVVATERKEHGRKIGILQDPESRHTDAAGYLESQLGAEELQRPEPFRILNGRGVLVTEDPQLRGIYAAIVLPDGYGIIISLDGEGAYGPSSRKLLRDIIESIQRVPEASKEEALDTL